MAISSIETYLHWIDDSTGRGTFDRMRRKRNDAFYDIAIIDVVEAEDAVKRKLVKAAEAYLKVIAADIRTRIP